MAYLFRLGYFIRSQYSVGVFSIVPLTFGPKSCATYRAILTRCNLVYNHYKNISTLTNLCTIYKQPTQSTINESFFSTRNTNNFFEPTFAVLRLLLRRLTSIISNLVSLFSTSSLHRSCIILTVSFRNRLVD